MRCSVGPTAAGLLVALTAIAAAQAPAPAAPAPTRFRDRFAAANTTHDGCLTQPQAEAGGLQVIAQNFAAIDTAHHGCVTLKDIAAFGRARRAAKTQNPGTAAPPTP